MKGSKLIKKYLKNKENGNKSICQSQEREKERERGREREREWGSSQGFINLP